MAIGHRVTDHTVTDLRATDRRVTGLTAIDHKVTDHTVTDLRAIGLKVVREDMVTDQDRKTRVDAHLKYLSLI